jgi:hypothetical protein
MINKYFIYFATMVLSAVLQQTWSQSQQHVWYFGNQKIDFTKPTLQIEEIPNMGNITPQFLSDGVHNEQGKMVMNIVDDKVYNSVGGLIGYLDSDLFSTPENVIIPFPGSTCKFIVLSTMNSTGNLVNTNSNIVDLAANNNQGSMSTDLILSSSNANYRDIVVGTLNANNERLFYTIDVNKTAPSGSNVQLRKYKISNTGQITLENSNFLGNLVLSNTSSDPAIARYITDSELSLDGQTIHLVNGSNKIYSINLSSSPISYSTFVSTYSVITSIERTPGGRIFFSHSQGIDYLDLSTMIESIDHIQNQLAINNALELTFNNTILAVNSIGKCQLITNADGSATCVIDKFQNDPIHILSAGIDGYSNLVHIPKQIDGENYIAKYANGSSNGCCTVDAGIDLVNLEISSTTTWSQTAPLVISGIIDIQSGTLLINQTEIHFTPQGKIIVRPGAKLKLVNSTLTSTNCGELWQGIELQGDANDSQDYFAQGEVNIGNSTIENALQGISVYGLYNNQIDWSKTGGKVISNNSTFRNNWKDVAFLSYSYPNKSQFNNTKFITSQALNNGLNPGWHVTMYDVSGVQFSGCEFTNSYSNSFVFQRGSGIKSIDSKFKVTGLCSPALPSSGPCQNFTFSSFNNLDFGIDATATNQNQTVEVSYSNFEEVIRGIALTGIDYSHIYENTIHLISSPVPSNLDAAVGIHVMSCESHSIENNSIYGSNTNTDLFGIVIDNSNLGGLSDVCNQVYRNDLHNLTYGITANKTNAKIQDNSNLEHFGEVIPFTGLVFKCNRFFESKVSDITATGPVAVHQGSTATFSHDPANNLFSENPSQQADFWYVPLDQNLFYYFEQSTNPSERTEPYTTLFNPSNTTLSPMSTSFNYTNSCPTKKYPFGTQVLINLKDVYADNVTQYSDSIDGGNPTLLIQAIQNDDPQAVYYQLEPLAGKLSNDVLRTLIDELPRIPAGVINSVLMNNTPLTQEVKSAVENSGLPSYYKSQLLSATGISPFDMLIQELSFNKKELDLVGNEIYRKIIADSSISNKLDTLIVLFGNKMNEEELLRFKIEFYISQNDQTAASNLLGEYNSTFDNSVYEGFQSILIQKLNEPGKILGALSDSSTANNLQSLISNDPTSREAITAVKLFEFLLNQEVYNDIDQINYLKSMTALSESIQKMNEITFNVFPNPTTDFISFDLGLAELDQADIEIVNIEGKVVFKGVFKANNSFLNVEDFKSGIFIMNVTYMNGVKAQTQFTKL